MDEQATIFRDVQFLPWPAHASFPSPADDYKERPLDLNELIVPHPVSTYFMRVEGDSMIGVCISSGDVLVVDRAITAAHNKIIVARLGEDFTVKRLQVIKGNTRLFLKPENPKYGVSISNPECCPLSKTGGLTNFLMWLHMQIEEKECEIGNVYPLA